MGYFSSTNILRQLDPPKQILVNRPINTKLYLHLLTYTRSFLKKALPSIPSIQSIPAMYHMIDCTCLNRYKFGKVYFKNNVLKCTLKRVHKILRLYNLSSLKIYS